MRREHSALVAPASGAAVARVDLIEPVGPVTYLDLTIGSRSIRACVNGTRRYQIGEEVGANFQPDTLHFFDGDSGVRISA
jgi:ABC-type sugar transport system ATPase subunit